VSQRLPRFNPNLQGEDAAKVDKLVEEAELSSLVTGVTAAGDESRLRGLPAVGRGCSGAIPGTRPGGGLR